MESTQWRPRIDLSAIIAIGFLASIGGIAGSSAATAIVEGRYAWFPAGDTGPNTFAYGVVLPAILCAVWQLSRRLSEAGRYRFAVTAAFVAPPLIYVINVAVSHDGQGALQEYLLVGVLVAFALDMRIACAIIAWDLAWAAANLWANKPAALAAVDFANVMALMVLLTVVIFVFRRQQERVEQRLYEASHTDALTGLGTRRTLQQTAQEVLATQQRYALVVFDIDNFAQYNTTYGHLGGDAVLRVVAQQLAAAVEPNRVFRTGGDEFVVLLPEHGRAGATRVAKRASRAVKSADVDLGDGMTVRNLSVSYGVAGLVPQTPFDTAFSTADAELYDARRHRRGALVGR